jgi:hypothetical protein
MAKKQHYQDIELRVCAVLLFTTSRKGPQRLCDEPSAEQLDWVRRWLEPDHPCNTPMFVRSAIRRCARLLQNPIGPDDVSFDGNSEKGVLVAIAEASARKARPPYLPRRKEERAEGIDRAARLLDECRKARKRCLDTFQPGFPFTSGTHRCFKCGQHTPVYSWLGQVEWTGRVPPRPWPSTVQKRTTEIGGSYYANTCSNPDCAVVLGDWYVFHERSQRSLADFAIADVESAELRRGRRAVTPTILQQFLARLG